MPQSKLLKGIRVFLATITLVSVVGALSPALSQKTTKKKGPVYYTVYANEVMRVRLNDELNSETSHVGDTFTATLVDPVYSRNGVILAPQGSTIVGRVTNVQRAQKKGKPATMDVTFISLKLPNGYRHSMNGSLTDLSESSAKSDTEGTVSGHKTSHRKAKFIGGGAAGGAVIGAIAGGGKGLAIGAGVGAVTGAITGRLKKGHELKVKSGTEFGVVVNRNFAMPAYRAAT
jgi:hypothetical protein